MCWIHFMISRIKNKSNLGLVARLLRMHRRKQLCWFEWPIRQQLWIWTWEGLWHDFGMDLEWFRDDLGTILGWLWDDFPNLLRQAKDGEILFSLAMIFLEFSNVLLSPKEAIQKIRTGNLGKSRTKTYKVESINNPKWNQKRYQFGYELLNSSLHIRLKV